MPFMHAEDKEEQGYSLRLIEALGDPGTLVWASHHQHVVARFGRFPHRNALLGRSTTLEEQAFLETSDFRG